MPATRTDGTGAGSAAGARLTTLVTGATGFAGGHLLDRLLGRMPLVAWHRPGRRPPVGADAPGLTWQAVDLLDRENVARALAVSRPDRVYHVAGAPRVDTAWHDVVPHLQTNVLGTHHLLQGLRLLDRPCRVVVVSSALVYEVGDEPIDEGAPLVPATPYGLSKLAQDQLSLQACHDDGMDVVVARPFNHIGPRQAASFSVAGFARQIARIESGAGAPTIHVGNLDARRDVTDVRDVAEAYERLMDAGASGGAYNVCSGHAVSIGEILEQLIVLSRTPVRIEVDAERLRPSDIPILVGNASRIRDEVGWRPRISLADSLRDTLEWWRGQFAKAPES